MIDSKQLKQNVVKAVEEIRATNPMAGSITNTVTIDFVANAQLAVGGSAAMVYLPDEGEALVAGGGAIYMRGNGKINISGSAQITAMGALALSLGIAIQNFPEGAIISMPLKAAGMSRGRAFWAGTLSGAVEPVGALFTIWAAGLVVPALPYLLSFAAGAMIYVVVEELIPEMSQGEHSNVGTICFALGFSVMMVLDVALG